MKQPRNVLWSILGIIIVVVAGWFGIDTRSNTSSTSATPTASTAAPSGAQTSQLRGNEGASAPSASASARPKPGDTRTSKQAATKTQTQSKPKDGSCPVDTLPREAADVIADIKAGGPFEHPENDGVRFGNYENRLPKQSRNYYREYTVDTPGVRHRGARRIVVGGGSNTDPDVWYYTSDHYDSFCEIPDAE